MSSSSRGTLNSEEYEKLIRSETIASGEKSKQDRIIEKRKKESQTKFGSHKSKAGITLKFANLLDEEQAFLTKLADLEHFNFEPDFKVNGKRFKDCKVYHIF